MRGARPETALVKLLVHEDALPAGGTVVLAVSGGSDSVALAGLAVAAARQTATQLWMVHVQHQLRASASQDEAVAVAVATQLGLPLRIVPLTPQRADEAHLRRLRYAALAQVAVDVGATAVLTGHTAQDQTETVLLALFRGTGPDGLCGMPARRPFEATLELVRPLLRVDRTQLQRYCERAALPYVVDPSNLDERYTRNVVRRHLKELRGVFPGLDRAVARCASLLREERHGDAHARARQALRTALHAEGVREELTYARLDEAARRVRLRLPRKRPNT